ncbi:hypothetical protein [Nibrella viscosa]
MRLNRDLPHNELYDFIIRVASGQVSLEECRMWFAAHTITFP